MTAKLLCGILFVLLITSLLMTVHLYCKYTKSYKDDFSTDEKLKICNCLEETRSRELIRGKNVEGMDYLIAKWEVVSGLADELKI